MAYSRTLAIIAAATLGLASGSARAGWIYNTLGGAENGGDPIVAAGPILGDVVTTTSAAKLSSVTLNLELSGAPTGAFEVFVATILSPVQNGDPTINLGTPQRIAIEADNSLTASFAQYTFSPATPIALAANTSYLIGIETFGEALSTVVFGNTVDPAVLGRPSVQLGAYYFNNGGVQANSGGPYEIAVDVVPEPAAFGVLAAGLGVVAVARRRA